METTPGQLFSPEFDRFYRTHERVMWDLGAIDFSKIQPELLSDTEVQAVRGVMLVESHNPVYTNFLLDYFRNDHEMAAFVVTWSYEELKHYMALRAYLEASGRVDIDEMEAELAQTRAGNLQREEKDFTPLQFEAYAMLQEQITGSYYKRFSASAKEPVLKDLLSVIGKDEYRHSQWYLEKGKQALMKDPRRVGEVVEVLSHFTMPGPTFIQNYSDYTKAFLRAVKLDVSALKESLSKIEQLTGRFDAFKAGTRVTYIRKISEGFGMAQKEAMQAV
ncbi:MAG: acyl-ACP desaturase [Chloroflexota bacterium]